METETETEPGAHMIWMVTISDSWCESLRLHLVFSDFKHSFVKNV